MHLIVPREIILRNRAENIMKNQKTKEKRKEEGEAEVA